MRRDFAPHSAVVVDHAISREIRAIRFPRIGLGKVFALLSCGRGCRQFFLPICDDKEEVLIDERKLRRKCEIDDHGIEDAYYQAVRFRRSLHRKFA